MADFDADARVADVHGETYGRHGAAVPCPTHCILCKSWSLISILQQRKVKNLRRAASACELGIQITNVDMNRGISCHYPFVCFDPRNGISCAPRPSDTRMGRKWCTNYGLPNKKKKKYVKTNFDNNVTAYYVEVELHATSLSLSICRCVRLSLSAFFSECERDLPSFSSNEKLCLCQAPVLLPTLHATYQVPSGKI
jgi:hypothetical protein